LNQRPHPYQLNAGNRCADRHSRRSPPTVRVKGMRSIGALVCVLRQGDPILTMEPPGTAVRTAVSPGHARPSRLKLSVLFRRSYAFSYRRALISRAGRNHTAVSGLASAVTITAAAKVQSPRDWRSGRWSASSKVNSPITVRFLQRSGRRSVSDTQPLPGSRPRPDGWNSATGPASAARRTPPARTRPAGRGC
jgi:hypothetical protein